uniref:GON domain-containing protein n=1 Tax=Cucumis melo TaxID=3656 RepID=A0A9I9CD43_CUCME
PTPPPSVHFSTVDASQLSFVTIVGRRRTTARDCPFRAAKTRPKPVSVRATQAG